MKLKLDDLEKCSDVVEMYGARWFLSSKQTKLVDSDGEEYLGVYLYARTNHENEYEKIYYSLLIISNCFWCFLFCLCI